MADFALQRTSIAPLFLGYDATTRALTAIPVGTQQPVVPVPPTPPTPLALPTSLSDTAIRAALREVIEGKIAGVRAVPVGLLSCDIAGGADDMTLSMRTTATPRVEIAIAYPVSPDRPQQPTNVWFRGIEVTLTYTYLLDSQALFAVDYQAVKATAAYASDLVAQALAWPGKVATSYSGTVTGIVSGVLAWQGTTVLRDDAPRSGQTEGGGLYQLEQRFSGTVVTTSAVA
jgi:hypothetical protein